MGHDAGSREDTSDWAMALLAGSFITQKNYVRRTAGSASWQGYMKHSSGHKDESCLGELRRLFNTTKMPFEAQHKDSSPSH